jgi:rfaE bifunctional protein kinase chain/domain/rfaE bifunctional protein nucleotidyltransferase chain/domain
MSKYPNSILRKIKTIEELCVILKATKKNNKKIVMCHGTFDIVHPGHIRHLLYAKEIGDILVASLTADKFVTKKKDGPFIPEDLRAKNLAALEIVDYVIIDENEKPLENLESLQPDFFVKGFEYSKDGIHPKTKEEIDIISSYGGEVIFSPGDVVYSSTNFQTIKKPNLSVEKLISIMEAEKIEFKDLEKVFSEFGDTKVHVVGDTIVDKYSFCSVLGPTTKTPTFSVKYQSTDTFIGGAGIVAKHLKSMGADVTFTTVLGDDELSTLVMEDLKDSGIKINAVVDVSRPTTSKERFWADGYKLLQVDTVDSSIVNDELISKIAECIKRTEAEIVIFSDFRHGIFNKESAKIFCDNIPLNAVKIADSQVSNRWGNILDFQNFDIIIPNEREARFALADQDSGVRPIGTNLHKKAKSRYLILKLGEKGIMVFRDSGENPKEFFVIESFVENLVDGIGAGDAMLAAASLAYYNSKNILISSIIGNIAAAIVCEVEGNVPVSFKKIRGKIKLLRERSFI